MEANYVELTMEQIGQSSDTYPTLPTSWTMDDMNEFLAEMIRWIATLPAEVGRYGRAKDGSSLLDVACETFVNFRKKLEECVDESEEMKLEGVLEELAYARNKYNEIGSMCEEDEEVMEQRWRRAFGLEEEEQLMDGHRELEEIGREAEEKVEGDKREDQVRQDPKEEEEREDQVRRDPEEDDAYGHRELEEKGREAEESEKREGNVDPEQGGEREDQVEQDPEEKVEREDQVWDPEEDDAYKLINGQDEGFKEDDWERGEGAKKGGLTRQWMDLFFHNSEVDGDEGIEDDGEEERAQPRVEDERGDRLTRGTERDSSLRVQLGRRSAEESGLEWVGKRVKS